MKPKLDHRPSFQPGDHARLNRALPPALCGSIVAVWEVSTHRGEVRYKVQPVEYEVGPVWAEECDLDWVLP